MSREHKMFGLRMPPELRVKLDQAALKNKRSLNQEIIERISKSLDEGYTPRPKVTVLTTEQDRAPIQLSEAETTMLTIFNRMPVERQLALLSLFK